ncbi:MAG: B12-binding domain-containing radical SAM protein [Candidatus Omnitrophica bacterium]|nr:MAG: B12 binding domain protein [Candidatus Hinthialibacteria bacterium OLB16]MCK6495785.1 B12-binding domain-containing radical SAM protein [bacterium]MCL4734361.1 B12-binding domain-containing radical SAM protein [Candidatus Omnitrophota bacterium]
MKVLFLFDDLILGQEPIGVTTISAVLKQNGHECEAINSDQTPNPSDLIEAVAKRKPNLLAVSTCTGQHKEMLARTRILKEALGLPVIYGGPHPTFFPEMIEDPGADVVCRSEGEYPMLEYVTAMQEGRDYRNTPNLWVKKDGEITRNGVRPNLDDLDSLPFSDKELVRPFEHLWKDGIGYFITARGCPFDCTFCYNHAQREIESGPNVRRRSPANVIKELIETKERYGFRYIAFQDDVFLIQNRWLNDFLPMMRDQVRLPFHCHSIANVMRSEELTAQLAEAGCLRIFFAVETGDEATRLRILKKPVKNSDLFRARDLCEKNGIDIVSSIMVGIPGETLESILGTIAMVIKTRVHCMIVHFFMPYPGTELGDEAVSCNAFDGNFDLLPACNHDNLVTNVNGPADLIEAIGQYGYWFLEKPWKFYATRFLINTIKSHKIRMAWMRYLKSTIRYFPESVYHLPEKEWVEASIQKLDKAYQQRCKTSSPPQNQHLPVASGALAMGAK